MRVSVRGLWDAGAGVRACFFFGRRRFGFDWSSGAIGQRKADGEGRAATGSRPQPHLAAVALHRVLDDREAEAGAAGAARARLVGAVEPLEHALLVALGDADAAIGDRDLDDAVDELHPDADARALRRIGDRVGDEVADGLARAPARRRARRARARRRARSRRRRSPAWIACASTAEATTSSTATSRSSVSSSAACRRERFMMREVSSASRAASAVSRAAKIRTWAGRRRPTRSPRRAG